MGTIGMALPETIARLNYGNMNYAIWASYPIAIILFWWVTYRI